MTVTATARHMSSRRKSGEDVRVKIGNTVVDSSPFFVFFPFFLFGVQIIFSGCGDKGRGPQN